ncbi:MAG: hypothetical protein ABIJ31_04850 [Pseudomonadota bacterium]
MKRIVFIFSVFLIIFLVALVNNHFLINRPVRTSSQIRLPDTDKLTNSIKPIDKIDRQDEIKQKNTINKDQTDTHQAIDKPLKKNTAPSQAAENSNLSTGKNENKDPLIESKNQDLENNNNTNAVDHIIQQFEADKDKTQAFNALIAIKDDLTGEDLQSAMKQMHQLSDIGGNEVLVDTFLDVYSPLTDHDKLRILSYINPEHKLSEKHLYSLSDAYFNESVPGASEVILMTVSQAGGDLGAQLIIDIMQSESNDEKYIQQATALGLSDSTVAFDYLNQKLNELVRSDTDDQNSEMINFIRTLIQKNIHY